MPSALNFDLSCDVTKASCENFRSLVFWQVLLQLVEVQELECVEAQVLSNSVIFNSKEALVNICIIT